MPVRIDFDRFRFERAFYSAPVDRKDESLLWADKFVNMGNDVVRELQRVGWDVPFVDVKIRHYGDGRNVIRVCDEVSFDAATDEGTERVTVRYGLKSGRKGSWNLTGTTSGAGVGEYGSDRKVSLWDDSGDWHKHEEMKAYLQILEGLVARLKALPSKPGHDVLHAEGDLNLRRLCESEPKLVHEHMPEKLYVWIKARELYNAYRDPYQHYEGDHAAEKDVVVPGSDYRMVPSGRIGDYKVPDAAWQGGNYASPVNQPVKRGLEFGAEYEGLPVEITLKDLNDVYVYDFADYRRAREAASRHAEETGEKDWKPGEFEAIKMKAMVTFVEAAHYKGGYEEPIFMIARQLHQDEARPMKGPIRARIVDGGAEAVMKDEVTGEEILLHEVHPDSSLLPVGHMKRSVEEARSASEVTGMPFRVDPQITDAIEAHRARLREEYKDDETMQMLI